MEKETLRAIVKTAVRNALTEDDKKRIRKLQAELVKIDQGVKFFFNIAEFERMGLIKRRRISGTDGWGDKVTKDIEFVLTDKARQILAQQI